MSFEDNEYLRQLRDIQEQLQSGSGSRGRSAYWGDEDDDDQFGYQQPNPYLGNNRAQTQPQVAQYPTKYYIVIGHKKGEPITDNRNGEDLGRGNHPCDWLEFIEREDIYGRGYHERGAAQIWGFLDVNYGECAQYPARASDTQAISLSGRKRVTPVPGPGAFGYQFVRGRDTKRIQFPEKITVSFKQQIRDNDVRRPSSNAERVDIEFTNPSNQILTCYDKECTIDPIIFQLSQFDNYGDLYIDLQDPENYKKFKHQLNHFVHFMKNYPHSNLFLSCSRETEAEIKGILKEAIVSQHLTNYIEFCEANFVRKTIGDKQSGTPFSEYDTFKESIDQFFYNHPIQEDRDNQDKKFYNFPFKNAHITVDAIYPWERYKNSSQFQNFLKHNPNISLEIKGAVGINDLIQFIQTHKIKATVFLNADPHNERIAQALAANRKDDLQTVIQTHQLAQLRLAEEQEPQASEVRLTVRKYLGQRVGLNNAAAEDEGVDMGQNQNQNQNQQQQMITTNQTPYEPIKLVVNSKSSIPDVTFETNQNLVEHLTGLKFKNAAEAPQIEVHIKNLFNTMQDIIQHSPASQGTYCPLSYSIEELLPGAFYIPKERIASIAHPKSDFNENKNTLFFSPQYAPIAAKKDLYAFIPHIRPVDGRLVNNALLDSIKNDKFVKSLLNDYQDQPQKEKMQGLLNKLFLKRGQAGIELFGKELYLLKIKNPTIYQTLLTHYLLTSADLSEYLETSFVETITSLTHLKNEKKLNWWNKIVEIQCRNNPAFDLGRLFKQFISFWEDLDKLQNFLPIPEDFPFNDFADAGITLGKMYRIMGTTKNRFEQIQNFQGGNISHAYMLLDMFNTSMYCKEMDAYAAQLALKLKAEDAFDKSMLKRTYFSLEQLNQLSQNPEFSLADLKSYLFIFAAVNGTTAKANNSDIKFYTELFKEIDDKTAAMSVEDKKTIFATVMLFAGHGNNSSIDNTKADLTQFLNQPNLIQNCKTILNHYSQPQLANYFSRSDSKNRMQNSEAMLSFHTASQLFTIDGIDNQKLMGQTQAWIMSNSFLAPTLQKLINESPYHARVVSGLESQPDYLKQQATLTEGLIQSLFLIANELNPAGQPYSAQQYNAFKTALNPLNLPHLIYLNQLFLDLDCKKAIDDPNCLIFKQQANLDQFIRQAKNLNNLDDLIFLTRHFKLTLQTIKPSKQALLGLIKLRENNLTAQSIIQYKAEYQEYIEEQLKEKLNGQDADGQIVAQFKQRILETIAIETDAAKLKGPFQYLQHIIANTKKTDMLKVIQFLEAFPLGFAQNKINTLNLLKVTDLLLTHVPLIDDVAHFFKTIKINNAQAINVKLDFIQSIFERLALTPACYEDFGTSKQKPSKKTMQQLKACLVLMEQVEKVDELTGAIRGNQPIEAYLQFIEASTSAANFNTPYTKTEFGDINKQWNTLANNHPQAIPELLDIARFNIGLLKDIQFRNIEQIKLVAKMCLSESLYNSRHNKTLDAASKLKFTQDIQNLLRKNLDINVFYAPEQLAHPSLDVLLKLLDHYSNDVNKAQAHFEKDPEFKRPHKKPDIFGKPAVQNKEAEFRATSFNMDKQNEVINIITSQFEEGFERSLRKNLLARSSIYINELGYRLKAFSHTNAAGRMSKVPARKLTDRELKAAFNEVKATLDQMRESKGNLIWQNKNYQRSVGQLLALIREALCRFDGKNAYSTQMDAVLMALFAGDYSYAIQINTGEGKAMISTLIAVALQALTGKQIVVTTSNLSLAAREAAIYDKFIKWFGMSHELITATTPEKEKLDAQIIHSTGADFALCHGKEKLIDNDNRIYINDEYDYTLSHLMPSINSQTKPNEEENWWLYEEILNYVLSWNANVAEATKDQSQQVQELIEGLNGKYTHELQNLQIEKAQAMDAIQRSNKPETEKQADRVLLEERLNGPILTLMKRLALLAQEGTADRFHKLIDSAIIATAAMKRGSAYEIIDQVQDKEVFKRVVPVENGKPIIEGDVMYMYGIHQMIIQKSILDFKADGEEGTFLKPPELESTTYFNNFATQAGTKSIGVTGTIPKPLYKMYQALINEGRTNVIPPHQTSKRVDAVRFEQLEQIKKGHPNVCQTEAQLVQHLINEARTHQGPTLIYCKDKNQCKEREEKLKEILGADKVQIIINGVTEDFTDGGQLTVSGRKAQQIGMVTLTVGDGRGIDLKPEGAGLNVVCSFVPETVEKLLQIYGRAGRNGAEGKSNFYFLENELQSYGQTFNNLAEKFKFLDEIRTREYDFAIKKIGYMQYAIQQKVRHENKRIELIGFMDNLYNQLILEGVVHKIKENRTNNIGAYQLSGRWEPYAMLNEDELDKIYQEFCAKTQMHLNEMNIEGIDLHQIKQHIQSHQQNAQEAIKQEKEAQKELNLNYFGTLLEQFATERFQTDPNINALIEAEHRSFEMNLSRLDKTITLMEQSVDNHLGLYGFNPAKIRSGEYQRIAQILEQQKEKVQQQKAAETVNFHAYLIAHEALLIVNDIASDCAAGYKENQAQIQKSINNMNAKLQHYNDQDGTIARVTQLVWQYCAQMAPNSRQLPNLDELKVLLVAKKAAFEKNENNTAQCFELYQQLTEKLYAAQEDLAKLAAGELENSELTNLYATLQSASTPEKYSDSVQALMAQFSNGFKDEMEIIVNYNNQAQEYQTIMQQLYDCQIALGRDASETKNKMDQYQALTAFEPSVETVFDFDLNHKKASNLMQSLPGLIPQAQAELEQIKGDVTAQISVEKRKYARRFPELEKVLKRQKRILGDSAGADQKLEQYKEQREMIAEEPSQAKRLSDLRFAFSTLQNDIAKENQILIRKAYYDKYKAAVNAIQKKQQEFMKRDLQEAATAAGQLYEELTEAGENYFNRPLTPQSYAEFKATCKASIDKGRDVLDQHRGWAKIVLNILAIVFTAGVGYAIAAVFDVAINGKFTLWSTDSSLKINAVGRCVNKSALPKDLIFNEAAEEEVEEAPQMRG